MLSSSSFPALVAETARMNSMSNGKARKPYFRASEIEPIGASAHFRRDEIDPYRKGSNGGDTFASLRAACSSNLVTTAELVLAAEKRAKDKASVISQLWERGILNDAYPFTHSRRENPSLEKAWAYFEHVALQRYFVDFEVFHSVLDGAQTHDSLGAVSRFSALESSPANDGDVSAAASVHTSRRDLASATLAQHSDRKRQKQQSMSWWYRCYRKVFQKGHIIRDRAEPGERFCPTLLYEPLWTPHSQLGDWGIGIGLYFSTLRALCST
jgi:hypothetical protein